MVLYLVPTSKKEDPLDKTITKLLARQAYGFHAWANGPIQPFEGFKAYAEDLRRRINVAVLFTDRSVHRLAMNVSTNFMSILGSTEMDALVCPYNFPCYGTLTEAEFPDSTDPAEIKRLIENSKTRICKDLEFLIGKNVTYHLPIADRAEFLLESLEITEPIFLARSVLVGIGESLGIPFAACPPLFETTIGHLTKVNPHQRNAYIAGITSMQMTMAVKPVEMAIADICVDTHYHLLTGEE